MGVKDEEVQLIPIKVFAGSTVDKGIANTQIYLN